LDIQECYLPEGSGVEREINVWLCVPFLKGMFSGVSKESEISVYYLGATLSQLLLRCEEVNI
jgi:hypothetical protein